MQQSRIPLHQEFEIGEDGNGTNNESTDLNPRAKLSIGVAFSVSLLVGFFVLGPVAHEGLEHGAMSKYINPLATRPGTPTAPYTQTQAYPRTAAFRSWIPRMAANDGKVATRDQTLMAEVEQGEALAVGTAPAYADLKTGAAVLVAAKALSRVSAPIANRRLAASPVMMAEGTQKKSGIDAPLLICFALWYLGNYYYNITNKLALNAAGGAAGFPMTIATLQLGVGVLYAMFMWLAPDAREWPKLTKKDLVKTLPVGLCAAGAHAASVFALSAGAVSFAQIVKAAEPAFAAVIGVLLYGAKVSKAKWLCLIPVIGGVCLASLGELSFAWAALGTAAIANVFAAVKANENKKLMETEGLKDRMGSVGNQFALTTISAFLFCLPVWLLTEAKKFGQFVTLFKTTPAVSLNMIYSGLWFYLYNELATLTIKKTGAVTQSVANTAKRVIVIIVVALVMGESLGALKLIGCGIGIGGVFLYSIIDKLVAGKKTPAAA